MPTTRADSPDTRKKNASPCVPRAELRYRFPVIAIEPDGDAFVSHNWNRSGCLLSDARLSEICDAGTTLSGSFTIEGYPGFGLFDSVIQRIDRGYGAIFVRFTEISAYGLRLIEMADSERPNGCSAPSGVLTIRLAYASYNWSASGLAISEDRGRFQCGQQIRGKIRVDRTQTIVPFSGLVLRVSREAEMVAIKLLHLGAGAQTLLHAVLHADPIYSTDASPMILGAV